MESKILQLKEEFTTKTRALENANRILKSEFVGIDNIIDEVIENVRSWYIMSSIQEKPTVINLWGLTGTGKTSLVLRLMELIDFSDKTYRFDLGEKEGTRSFKNSLSELCENKDDAPIAIVLDELQHARTLVGPSREEIENDENRMIWELIDSGKVSYIEWRRGMWMLEDVTMILSKLLNAGVKVRNGKVTTNKSLYQSEMEIEVEDNQPLLFVPENEYDRIIDLAGKKLKISLKKDLKDLLTKLNGDETLFFLRKVLTIAKQPAVKNFSKAIIFVLGNVDEAYSMSGNFNADISADAFYEISLEINVPEIKKALRQRFRDEQIARLGNIHIIYPALSSESYFSIIRLELSRLKTRIYEMLDIQLEFEDSLVEEIYKEGVYPTQGARPLFTTIHQMVKSKLAVYMNVILEHELVANKLVLSVTEGQLMCKFYNDHVFKFVYTDTITSNLEKLRKPKFDEEQAIAAVHEAGHAVLLVALMNTIPEMVVSVTSDTDAFGFVFSKNDKTYYSRADVIPRTAVKLGGIVAEELIFGEEHLTSGGSSDLRMATGDLMSLYKQSGFGSTAMNYSLSKGLVEYSYHNSDEIENEVKQVLEEAKLFAREKLMENKTLLLAMADVLSEEPKLDKEKIKQLVELYSDIDISKQDKCNFYREKLKAQVMNKGVLESTLGSNPLVLNRGGK